MSKQLTEAQVLEKLNIPDFRHLSKDNVMSFASMIQDMDPEVAKKALEQFPDFAKSTMDALKDIKSVIDKSFEDDKESANQCYALYNRIQNALEKCLDNDNLSFEERKYYIEQMKEVAQMASAKDSEGKKFKWSSLAVFGTIAIAAIGTMAAILGGKTDFELPSKKDYMFYPLNSACRFELLLVLF